jgi:hypothetical protein
MFCRKCGTQLKPEAKFCKQCGNPVAAAQPLPSVPMPPPQQPAQRAPDFRPTAPANAAMPARTAPVAASPEVPPVTEGITRELTEPPPPQPIVAPPPAPAQFRAVERQPEAVSSLSNTRPSTPKRPAESARSATIPPLPPRAAYRSAIAGPPPTHSSISPTIIVIILLVVAAAGAGYFLYARSNVPDATIVANLQAKFDSDASLHNATIGVTSQNGVVILVGYVGSDADNSNAIRIAGAEPGVKQIVAHLVTQDQVRSIVTSGPPGANSPSTQGQNSGQTLPNGGDTSNQSVQTPTPAPQGEQSSPPAKALDARDSPPPFVQPTPIAPATRPAIVQAVTQPAGTSLQLASGQLYIYGMVTGGAQQSGPFATGQVAQVVNGTNNLAAAFAYGDNPRNGFSTPTYNHAIGGVSVSGHWDDFHAYYGSNARPGASIVAASFTVNENSLVVIIGLAAGQTRVSLQGIPGLQVDGASSDAGGGMPMMIAHATLSTGTYTAVETSADTAHQDAASKADLIGVFVFGSKQ